MREAEGTLVGEREGLIVGDTEGDVEGPAVGDSVGGTVGDAVGDSTVHASDSLVGFSTASYTVKSSMLPVKPPKSSVPYPKRANVITQRS